jgi:hypothetical protein
MMKKALKVVAGISLISGILVSIKYAFAYFKKK